MKMTEGDILRVFKLEPISDEAILRQIYKDQDSSSQDGRLQCWLALLPDDISDLVQLALRQDRPFQPPGVTPEKMAETNDNVPSMNQIEILCRSIATAISTGDLTTAAALVYVVDRAVYRFGDSRGLLSLVDTILGLDARTPFAPQVIIRKARVMKDDGDLHGAIRVLDAVISRESVWDYKSDDHYNNVKAVCVQVKGQILHNLGLWKEAIEPLVESVHGFNLIGDDKGTSSSLGLLSKCLKKLTLEDFAEMRMRFPTMFTQSHPCYEAYIQGNEAVRYIADLGQTLYSARHQLVAEECLLMYALQQPPSVCGFQWFESIVKDIKQTLTTHKTVTNLKSVETYYEFVRAVYLIQLTLYFSPIPQDRSLSKYLEQVSIEMYRHLCSVQSRRDLVTTLEHTSNSINFMNATLGILGLPALDGSSSDDVSVEAKADSTQVSSKENVNKTEKKRADKAATFSGIDAHVPKGEKSATFSGVGVRNDATKKAYSTKYVGLPVDASTFSESSNPESSGKESTDSDVVLVNISVASIGETAEKMKNLHQNSTEFSHPFTDSSSEQKLKVGRLTSSSSEKSSDLSSFEKLSISESSDKSTSSSFEKISAGSLSQDSSSGSQGPANSASSSNKKSSQSDSSSYVDLSATTQDSYSWHHVSDDLGELSPLVDLNSSKVSTSLESLHLGKSVETDSAVEYLDNWTPPLVDETINVSKALLLTYNPVSGQWLSQSTLVHIGQELDLGGNRPGNCRDVFEVHFLHQDEPLGRYVCKRYRQQRPARYYQQDVVCQMMAGYYVTRFNQALQHHHSNIQVQFLPAFHLQLLSADGQLYDWVNVEPFLKGSFTKLTNNLSFANRKEQQGEQLATAFTHFSYCQSQGTLMVVDIQGWLPKQGGSGEGGKEERGAGEGGASGEGGIVYLTDPQFHTRHVRRFSPADKQEEGMALFWSKVHPRCNAICQALGLERPQ